jgi:hypothetical protein
MENVIVALLLFPFIVMNIVMSQARAMGARLGRLTSTFVPEEEVATPQVEALRRRMTRVLSVTKMGVGILGLALGIYALSSGRETVSLGSVAMVIAAAVAFRNGSDLSRMVVYSRHDAGVIRARSADVPAGGLLARILAIGILVNALFIALWAVLFFVIQAGAKSAMGVDVSQWVLILWGVGMIVGAAIAGAIARRETRFLLRDELGVGVFLGVVRLHHLGEGGRQAALDRIKPPRLWRAGSWRLPPRGRLR